MKKMKKQMLATKYLQKKCGDKEAPVSTFMANAFLPLDTAEVEFTTVE
jgi:hypothetical protein